MERSSPIGTIRLAGTRDAPTVASLWFRSRLASVPAIPAPAHSAAEVLSWFASDVIPKGGTWVVEVSGELVALLVFEGGWVDQLYVEPDRTGKGCGSALLEHAKEMSDGVLELWTFQSNARALAFYARHGFTPIDATDGDNEEHAPDVRLRWSAAPAPTADAVAV